MWKEERKTFKEAKRKIWDSGERRDTEDRGIESDGSDDPEMHDRDRKVIDDMGKVSQGWS